MVAARWSKSRSVRRKESSHGLDTSAVASPMPSWYWHAGPYPEKDRRSSFFTQEKRVFGMQEEKAQVKALEKAKKNPSIPLDQIPLPNKWAVLAILAIGIFMVTLDSSIVNIGLPSIAHYFGVPLNGAV